MYNETSEAENMALAVGMGLLMHPDCWFLPDMEQADIAALTTCAIVLTCSELRAFYATIWEESIWQHQNMYCGSC